MRCCPGRVSGRMRCCGGWSGHSYAASGRDSRTRGAATDLNGRPQAPLLKSDVVILEVYYKGHLAERMERVHRRASGSSPRRLDRHVSSDPWRVSPEPSWTASGSTAAVSPLHGRPTHCSVLFPAGTPHHRCPSEIQAGRGRTFADVAVCLRHPCTLNPRQPAGAGWNPTVTDSSCMLALALAALHLLGGSNGVGSLRH